MQGRSWTAAVLAMLMTTVAAATAVPAPGPAPAWEALAEHPEGALAQAEALVAAASLRSPTAALQGMLQAQGMHEQPLPVPFTPAAGTPPELAIPIGRLLAAVALAEALRAEAIAPLTAEEQALVLEHGLVASTPLALPALPGGSGSAVVAGPSGTPFALIPQAEAIAAKVDQAKLRIAGLTLLAAVEASATELGAASLLPGTGIQSHCGVTGTLRFESSGCEVVVGDVGPNTYSNPNILVIADLGGDDTYLNGAALAKSGVRVLVDNAGNDAYTVAKSAAGAGQGATAEGIASASLGVAVLADLSGRDTYTATASTTAPQPGAAAGTARVLAMGVANIGAAILVDAGGRDTFLAQATSSGGGATIYAQGQAGIGLGALVNLGADAGADDVYTTLPRSTLHVVLQDASTTQYTIGPADAQAQGASQLAGVGLLADAGGNDAYLAQPNGAVALLFAQGATIGGVAALVDAQGDDTMTASALGDTTLSLVAQNGGNNSCWTVTVTVTTGETRANGQGQANPGAAILADGGGVDVRLLEARSHAGAIGGVNTTFDCSPFGLANRVTSTATSGPGTAVGQGSGASGAGLLVDLAGADRNTLRGRSTALAYAVVNGPGTKVETATATAGTGQTFGQGHSLTGVGILADAAGNDAYASEVLSQATRTTSAGTTIATGPTKQDIHAWGNGGAAWLLELEGTDAYSSPGYASPAGNSKCWTHGPNGGRGRDVPSPAALLTQGGCIP